LPWRLTERGEEWVRRGLPKKIVGWVRDGVGVGLNWGWEAKAFGRCENRVKEGQVAFVDNEVRRFWRLGVARVVQSKPMFCCPLVVAWKGGECFCKTWRLCVNGRGFDRQYVVRGYRMEGLKFLRHIVRRGWYMTKVDLSDFYLHFRFADSTRGMVGFQWRGSFFELRACLFGFKISAYVAATVSSAIARWFRIHHGIHVTVWVDDFIVAAHSSDECRRVTHDIVLPTLRALGFLVNTRKSCLDPAMILTWLGMVISSAEGRLYMSATRIARAVWRIDTAVLAWLHHNLTARKLAAAIGVITSAAPACQAARLARIAMDPLRMRRAKFQWDYKVDIPEGAVAALLYIRHKLIQNEGRLFLPPPRWENLYTDAADYGWGLVLNPKEERVTMWGLFDEFDMDYRIDYKEMIPQVLAVEEPVASLLNIKGKVVQPWIDNSVALSYIAKGGGRKGHLEKLAVRFTVGTERCGVQIWAPSYVNTNDNWADDPSRFADRGGWVSAGWVRRIALRWSPDMSMDVMADRNSSLFRRFYGREGTFGATAINAYLHEWDDEVWLVPPLSQLDAAVRTLADRAVHATGLFPGWAQAWSLTLGAGAILQCTCAPGPVPPVAVPTHLRGKSELCAMKGWWSWTLIRYCPRWAAERARREPGLPMRGTSRSSMDGHVEWGDPPSQSLMTSLRDICPTCWGSLMSALERSRRAAFS
jgi:hypothetical protein